MNPSWKHFILVKFPIAMLLVGLLLVPVALAPRPMQQRLQSLHEDGVRLGEVYDRIAVNPRPIDVAFIGTSQTMHAIDDRGIEDALSSIGIHANVANLGTMWMGRDLHVLLTKALLEHKKPKLIVLEINEHETPYGHPLTPYVASASDMFCCQFWFDLDFPKSLLLFLKEQEYGLISRIWQSGAAASNPGKDWDFGWRPFDRIWNPNEPKAPSFGDKVSRLLGNSVRDENYNLTSMFGDAAVRQIVKLATDNNVKIVLLYLSEYAVAANPDPDNIRFHEGIAPTIIFPQSVAEDRRNWADFAHFNRSGASKAVPDLSAKIAAFLTADDVRFRQSADAGTGATAAGFRSSQPSPQ
jgi:hypothetical protein